MKKYILYFSVILVSCFTKSAMAQAVSDQLRTIPQDQLKLYGFVGMKTDLIINNRVKTQDYDYLVVPFRHAWGCGFLGIYT
jgi:hypothetical protein